MSLASYSLLDSACLTGPFSTALSNPTFSSTLSTILAMIFAMK